MIEAYKIAVNMTLTGDAHKKMMEFSALVEKTSTHVEKLMKLLKGMNTTLFTLGKEVKISDRALKGFDTSLDMMGKHALTAENRINRLRTSVKSLDVATKSAKGGFGLGSVAGFVSHRLAPAAIGYGAYSLGKSAFETGSEYEQKINQLVARGFTPAQIAGVRGFTQATHIQGVSQLGMVDAFVDALMATSDPTKARFLAPTLARGQFAAQVGYGGMSHHQQQELIRFAEFRGAGNAEKIRDQLELGMQMMALSGGSIKPNELRALTKYGGGAVSKLSNQALLALEPVMQMRGGSSTGTALQTLNLSLIAGQMSTARGRSLQSLGLFDTNAISYDASGRTLGSKFGKFKHGELLQHDPFGFLMQKYLPALAKQGITSPEKVEQRIQYDFSRTASQILISMYENSDKILRTLSQAGLLQKGTPMYEAALRTPGGAALRFEKSWENFKLALDKFDSPQVTAGLAILSKILDALSWSLSKLSSGGGTITGGITSAFLENNLKIPNVTDIHSVGSAAKKIEGVVTLGIHKVGTFLGHLAPNSLVNHGQVSNNAMAHGVPNAVSGASISSNY